MGTDFTQDTVLHYLQSSGGSVKNSDLLLHFRSFIRDHEDRDRYRDLFKKFVNSVATVQQLDGVSYVVLRKKFKGYVPGRGGQEGVAVRPSGQPRPPADRTPAAATASPARSTDKPLQKPPKLREGTTTTPAPPGGTPAGRTVLPAAGILVHNNNKVETNVSQKQEQQTMITPQVHIRPAEAAKEVLSTPLQGTTVGQIRGGLKLDPPPGITPDVHIRPAAAQVMNQISQRTDLKIPNLSELPGRNKSTAVGQLRGLEPPPGITPVVSAVKHQGETSQQVPVPQPLRGREVCLQPQKGLHEDPPIHHGGPEPQAAPRRFRHRPSYKSALSYDDDEDELEEEVVPMRRGSAGGGGGGAWPLGAPLGDMEKAMSASSPCILDPRGPPSPDSSSREKKIPKICIQDMEGELMPRPGGGLGLGSGVGHRGQWSRPSPDRAKEVAPRREVNVDLQYSQHPGVQMMEPRPGPDQSQRERLSSSHSTGLPRTDRSPPGSSPRGPGWNSSHEDLQSRAGKPMGGREIQEVLQRAQQTNIDRTINKTTAPWHHSAGHLHDHQEPTASSSPFHHSNDHLHDNKPSAGRVFPLHQSTGDLYDDPESSGGSASSPPPWQHPAVARRLSNHRRNRMCRSVGADLDQILPEGGSEAARLNRLHMISSSLSLRYNLSTSSLSSCSTPPRCTSLADLTEGPEEDRRRHLHTTTSSSFHPECPSSRQSLVPLEPREHAWLVKGAAGSWPDIYSLFREDPSLLNRQDFISGFTVLHWIAKHGDHRVLNTLWYGVEKAGLSFDINSRSTCGHTPLHIAAMHGHKNIVRLLVNRFSADARLRDTAGKKPWQYLSGAMPPDVFTLLGAPVRAVVEGGGRVDPTTGAKQELLQPHPQSQQRRRRHHLSMASSRERPLTASGTTRVKRSSSIAAFLKHKSLLTFHGHKSDSSLEKS